MDPVSWVLGLLLLAYAGGDMFKSHQDRSDYKEMVALNHQQAKELTSMSGNIYQSAQVITGLVIKGAETERKYQEILAKKDATAGEQLGILATQAESIANTTPASDTIKHHETAVSFMEQAGGSKIDEQLAWNKAYVAQNLAEMARIKALLEKEQQEKLRVQAELSASAAKNDKLASELVKKAEAHEQTAIQVKVVEGELHKTTDWLSKLKRMVFWASILAFIGFIGFVIYHIYNIFGLRKVVRAEAEKRRIANQEKYEAEALAGELKTSVKTFFNIGPEGNEQMKNILKANGLKKHFEDILGEADIKSERL